MLLARRGAGFQRWRSPIAALGAVSRLSTAAAADASPASGSPPALRNLIGGEFVESRAQSFVDVVNPATQEVVSRVPLTTDEEFKAAVGAAKRAFPAWRNTPVTARQRIMFKLQELIRRDMDKLALNITTEQGKTLRDAQGDVFRGLEVVEHACGMATLQMGEFVSNVSHGIDTYSIREPLGVCAGICPFNFPAMIPLWMFPVAVTCGNTFVLKPSEKDPGAAMMLAELAMEAGLPNGVLNIVHGTAGTVNNICDNDDIKAISFVGSNTDLQTRKTIGGGHESGGLYYLTASRPFQPYHALLASDTSYQWHCRLGHPSISKLRDVVSVPSTINKFHCDAYELGKHHRVSFPLSQTKGALLPSISFTQISGDLLQLSPDLVFDILLPS